MPTGADLVKRYVHEQVEALRTAGQAMNDGRDDAVHDVRVACRRLRSTVLAYRRLLRPGSRRLGRALADQLREHAALLSSARDDEVLGGLVTAWAEQEHWGADGAAQVRAALGLDGPSGPGVPDPVSAVLGAPTVALAVAVEAFVEQARWAQRAGRPASDALLPPLRRTWHRTSARVATAEAAAPAELPTVLHDLRKAAKRLRYTAEVVTGHIDAAAAVAETAKALQTALGARQDAEVAHQRLVESLAAGRDGAAVERAAVLADEGRRAADASVPALVCRLREAASALG